MNHSYNDIAKAGTYQTVAHSLSERSTATMGAYLADNREGIVAQKKQADGMAASAPIQRISNNTGLPDQLKSGIEGLSGHSMDDVKVHYNSAKPAQLNAHAYAQGTDIHIAAGQEKHLPHEAWHVVQQKQGRVQPTMQMKGRININDDKGLEKEADVMGSKALQARGRITSQRYHRGPYKSRPVQLKHYHTVQFAGKALTELKAIAKQIPAYMLHAFWRWVALVGAGAAYAYFSSSTSILATAAKLFGPSLLWLGLSTARLIHNKLSGGEGKKIGTGPYIEDTFHVQTYSIPWWSAGSYKTATKGANQRIANGRYIFVVLARNTMRYLSSADRDNKTNRLYVRHSQLANGQKVLTAGRLIVTANQITLTNESGHYTPDIQSVRDYAQPIINSVSPSGVSIKVEAH